MTGSDVVGQGQGVRAGEPVRAHESRCSGAPPFNVQADCAGEKERKLATSPALLLEWVLHTNHEGKQGMLLRLPANHWSFRGSDWGTEGLVRWRLAGLPRPELSHSDL